MTGIIDAHLHSETLSWKDLERMSMMGIQAAVSVPVCPWRAGVKTTTHIALIERLLSQETWRAEKNNIRLYLGVGVISLSVPEDVENFYPKMEEYLKDDRVVAIGEVGFEPRSRLCSSIKKQKEILKIQLEMAKRYDMPVIMHTPPDLNESKIEEEIQYEKLEFMDKTMEVIHEVGLQPERVVLDHLDNDRWVRYALDNKCYAGISIQEWRGTDAQAAANWGKEYGPERIIFNTDTSGMPSDPLGVPKVAFNLHKMRVAEEKIQKMVYENAFQFYNLKH